MYNNIHLVSNISLSSNIHQIGNIALPSNIHLLGNIAPSSNIHLLNTVMSGNITITSNIPLDHQYAKSSIPVNVDQINISAKQT